MADLKISQLNSIVTVVPATDVLPVVQGGTTLKITPKQILESGSPAVLASATITGALTVDTTTLVVNPSGYADRVGIGTATPATTLDVNGDITQRNGSGTIIGNIQNSSGLYDVKASANVTGLQLSTAAATPIVFAINNAEAMRLNASGNLAFPTGKGIDFSAVTGGTGTATANVLNDYEEGTWVPTQGAGLTVVGAFSSNGTYTKVGRLVTINGVVIGATSIAVAATSILCAGLPFSATNEATTTSVNGSFTASSFCAINAANLYAVTSMVASTSIRFTATYYV